MYIYTPTLTYFFSLFRATQLPLALACRRVFTPPPVYCRFRLSRFLSWPNACRRPTYNTEPSPIHPPPTSVQPAATPIPNPPLLYCRFRPNKFPSWLSACHNLRAPPPTNPPTPVFLF